MTRRTLTLVRRIGLATAAVAALAFGPSALAHGPQADHDNRDRHRGRDRQVSIDCSLVRPSGDCTYRLVYRNGGWRFVETCRVTPSRRHSHVRRFGRGSWRRPYRPWRPGRRSVHRGD